MPRTLHLRASEPQHVARAAEILRAGGTVAFPTETVYGLGANALSAQAVAGIFAAKQRPFWDPLIVHVAARTDALELVSVGGEIARRAEALAQAFWPGPLTLLLPRSVLVPDVVTAGRSLVGVRIPAHSAAQALLRAARLPLAAPSANVFGHTSPTTAQHVLDDLDGRIDAVLDGGATSIGLESTVLDPTATPMVLYRPGALTPEELAEAAGVDVAVFQPAIATARGDSNLSEAASQAVLPAPGVGIRHYAPRARLLLVEGSQDALHAALQSHEGSAEDAGVLLPADWSFGESQQRAFRMERWATWSDARRLASRLFAALRALDALGVEVIYCPVPEAGGLRDAIRDRLRKAAHRP